jgi:CBS domain-containing protein
MIRAVEDRASRYLDAFSEIEQHLRAFLLAQDHQPFTVLLAEAIGRVPGASIYQHELRQFSTLRNAIVHMPSERGRPIADPREDAVERIEVIRDALLSPRPLRSVLRGKVRVATTRSTIGEAAGAMLDGDFSQLPVIGESGVVDLLTSEAVARWMTDQVLRTGAIDLSTPVTATTAFDADRAYEVVPRDASVLEAIDLFEAHEARGEPLHAILVRKSPAGALVAIATATDLPAIMAAARPAGRS